MKTIFLLVFLLVAIPKNVLANSSSTSLVGIDQGAARMFVGSGGKIDIESGGEFDLAGSAMSCTAAELNTLHSVVAGTASASKAVVLDSSKKIDTLDITTLKLGGTAVSATASALNQLDETSSYSDGISRVKLASATYDFSVNGGTISAINLGVSLPAKAVVIGGFVDVITTVTTASSNTGTIALSVEGANDLVSAIAPSDVSTPWAQGLHAIVPVFSAGTAIKTTTTRNITATIASHAVTAGKFTVFLFYVLSH